MKRKGTILISTEKHQSRSKTKESIDYSQKGVDYCYCQRKANISLINTGI